MVVCTFPRAEVIGVVVRTRELTTKSLIRGRIDCARINVVYNLLLVAYLFQERTPNWHRKPVKMICRGLYE